MVQKVKINSISSHFAGAHQVEEQWLQKVARLEQHFIVRHRFAVTMIQVML